MLATSIARAVVNRATRSGFPQAVFNCEGRVRIIAAGSRAMADWLLLKNRELIGIYDRRASVQDVCDDLLEAC